MFRKVAWFALVMCIYGGIIRLIFRLYLTVINLCFACVNRNIVKLSKRVKYLLYLRDNKLLMCTEVNILLLILHTQQIVILFGQVTTIRVRL